MWQACDHMFRFFTRIMPFTLFCCAVLVFQGFALWSLLLVALGQFLQSLYFIVCGSGRLSFNLVSRGPFCHALEIGIPDQVQQHSGFEWLCKHNRLRLEPIRFVKLDSGHGQSDGKSVNRGLPVLDLARGHDPCRWPKGSWPLGMRLA